MWVQKIVDWICVEQINSSSSWRDANLWRAEIVSIKLDKLLKQYPRRFLDNTSSDSNPNHASVTKVGILLPELLPIKKKKGKFQRDNLK